MSNSIHTIYKKLQSDVLSLHDIIDPKNSVSGKECIEKIIKGIFNFLSNADLYSLSTETRLKELPIPAGAIQLTAKLDELYRQLEKIRKLNLPREFIGINCNPVKNIPLIEQPSHSSYAAILINFLEKDKVIYHAGIRYLQENSPLVLSERTFLHILPSLNEVLPCYRFYFNKQGHLILCLPKNNNFNRREQLLAEGYDSQTLEPLLRNDLMGKLSVSKKISSDTYEEDFVKGLKQLYRPGSNTKKRLHMSGHGLSYSNKIKKEPWIAGVKLKHFREILCRFEEMGVDYINYATCHGGGKNILKTFRALPHRFTVSVCSVADIPSLADVVNLNEKTYLDEPNQLVINVAHLSIRKFWNEISLLGQQYADLSSKEIEPDAFRPALDAIYGHSLSCLPSIAVGGEAYFHPLSLGSKVRVLEYPELITKAVDPLQKITVREEALLVYPQVISTPIELYYHEGIGAFPLIISKIPDDHQIYFSKVIVFGKEKTNYKTFIKNSLSRTGVSPLVIPYQSSHTRSIIAVKDVEFFNADKSGIVPEHYSNCLSISYPTDTSIIHSKVIFQKMGGDQWFLLNNEAIESKISQAQAALIIYEASLAVNTSDEALDWSSSSMPEARQNNTDFINALKETFFVYISEDLMLAFEYVKQNDMENFWRLILTLDESAQTALFFFIIKAPKMAFIPSFLGLSSVINAIDEDNFTAIDYLLHSEDIPAIKLLFETGFDLGLLNCPQKILSHVVALADPPFLEFMLNQFPNEVLKELYHSATVLAVNLPKGENRDKILNILLNKVGHKFTPFNEEPLLIVALKNCDEELVIRLIQEYNHLIFPTDIQKIEPIEVALKFGSEAFALKFLNMGIEQKKAINLLRKKPLPLPKVLVNTLKNMIRSEQITLLLNAPELIRKRIIAFIKETIECAEKNDAPAFVEILEFLVAQNEKDLVKSLIIKFPDTDLADFVEYARDDEMLLILQREPVIKTPDCVLIPLDE